MKDKEMIGKANFYLERAVTTHIKTANYFYNGLIREIVGEEFLIFNDRMLGEIKIYFSEIERIEPFKFGGGK